ncbi:hypothetical protein [Pedobacter sp. BMA]|uniref:hypothetical protein n=1 Tax=Pedobacter sp. BMA TaxID=1663685 RepID=UPI00064A199B|nr:hypothetical protein [Pedobacter sp. BMA]KLT64744.1 hypothetical protein AB669_13445 [Pedobacter sp. BMA]
MKYSKQATLDLAKSLNKEECLQGINQLTLKEGSSDANIFTDGEVVLDMDCVEHKFASIEKRSPVKSMDSAFVTTDSTGTKSELVMVEYRFNYKNLANLSRVELLQKVAGSTAAAQSTTNVHPNYYFVFNSNLKNQAISRLARMNPVIPQHYKAIDLKDIQDLFFS